jgi:ribosomal protein S18 acetylase RimI-like enzyme
MRLVKWIVDARRALNALSRRTKDQNLRVLAERGETVEGFTIRDATVLDIPALAKLHVITWNACYQAHGPSVAIRAVQWIQQFARQDGSWFCLLVARANGELIGFAKGKRSDHPGFNAELNKIYLLPEYQRVGIGKRLLRVVVRRFLDMGLTSMWLIGEADNPSTAFHEAMGGYNRPNDDGTMNYGNYFWDDLQALARRLDSASTPARP